MAFNRPELEKDNPVAPQPYVGPRRRHAKNRASSAEESARTEQITERLRMLAKAASRFVNTLPKTKKADEGLTVLREAIVQAERALSVKGRSVGSRADI
ncbi:MAG: hypothetical protein OEY86_04915 [Nitrospira sp.]|nr:hypothetical protein [Nitrospira sp.]